MYVAVRIHNNSLGRVVEVESAEEGKNLVHEWAKEQLGRGLNGEELDDLENGSEIYNEEDPDNIWCFSLGITE